MADPKDNLIKSADFPPEERSRRARIAAKASAEARKKKKSMKDAMNLLLKQGVSEKNKATLRALGIDDDNLNNLMLVMVSAFQKAVNGDVDAMRFIADVTGNKAMSESERERMKLEKKKLEIEKLKLEGRNRSADEDDSVVIINDT